jgi:hypothetical protein
MSHLEVWPLGALDRRWLWLEAKYKRTVANMLSEALAVALYRPLTNVTGTLPFWGQAKVTKHDLVPSFPTCNWP